MSAVWERECRVYSRFLIGQEPGAYIERKYKEFHEQRPAAGAAAGAFDGFLLTISRWHPWMTRIADTYASRFARAAALRRKLVLTMALLECGSPSFERLDTPYPGGLAGTLFHGVYQGTRYILLLAIAAAVLGPVHLLLRGAGSRSPR